MVHSVVGEEQVRPADVRSGQGEGEYPLLAVLSVLRA